MLCSLHLAKYCIMGGFLEGILKKHLSELAQKLSDKKQMDYSIVIHWLRAKLSFNLLRSAVLCVRGSRTIKHELNTDLSGAEIANVIGKIK